MKSYVTMEQCCLCGKSTGSLLLDKRLRNVFDSHTVTGNICPKCEDAIKNNVSFYCDTCKGLMVITMEGAERMGLKVKKGDKFRIYKCTSCTGDNSIEFLPPKEEEKE